MSIAPRGIAVGKAERDPHLDAALWMELDARMAKVNVTATSTALTIGLATKLKASAYVIAMLVVLLGRSATKLKARADKTVVDLIPTVRAIPQDHVAGKMSVALLLDIACATPPSPVAPMVRKGFATVTMIVILTIITSATRPPRSAHRDENS